MLHAVHCAMQAWLPAPDATSSAAARLSIWLALRATAATTTPLLAPVATHLSLMCALIQSSGNVVCSLALTQMV